MRLPTKKRARSMPSFAPRRRTHVAGCRATWPRPRAAGRDAAALERSIGHLEERVPAASLRRQAGLMSSSDAAGRATLRVAHVLAPAPFGGLEQVVRALSSGQARRGHEVHVVQVFE